MPAILPLKQRRQFMGLTQAQVAKSIGVSQPTYQNYEAGTTPIPAGKVDRLARALKMPIEQVRGSVREKEREEYKKGFFPDSQYWGEIVVHFAKGPPLVVSIDFQQKRFLFSALQQDSKFFSIESRYSNQLIGIRRAAATDVYLSDDGSDTFGPEHGTYDLTNVGISGGDAFWEIADELLSDEDRGELNEKYGEEEVNEVARAMGLDMPNDIDRLIKEGKVKEEDRDSVLKEAEQTVNQVRQAVKQITWQFSDGKVRREDYDYDSEFLRYWWIRDNVDPEGQGSMIIVDVEDAQTAFINPEAIDYISVPLHKFEEAENEEENSFVQEEEDEDEAPTKVVTKIAKGKKKAAKGGGK